MPAFLLALLVRPSPAPLKTIEHVYSSRFCSALRNNIGHAVRGILSNHDVIVSGKVTLLDLARDQAYSAAPAARTDVEMVKLDRAVGDMVKNLAVTDEALDQLARAAHDAAQDSDPRLQLMQQQLRAVADRQRDILNIFSGLYESHSSNELAGAANPLAGAIDRHAASESQNIADDAVAPDLRQRSSGTPPTPAPVPPVPSPLPTAVPEVDIGLAGISPRAQVYSRLFNAVTTYQIREQKLETEASRTIVAAAADCSPHE